MKNRVTELLEIKYPVIQGGMARISTGTFAAKIAETGVLGVIAGAGLRAEEIRKEISDFRMISEKPLAVNIPFLYKELVSENMNVIIEEKVKIVITSAGNPKEWVSLMKNEGIKVLCVVGSPEQAEKAEKCGVDAIIAEGSESGGHIGEINTFPLIPAVADVVSLPVIAAGGIADARGMAAAFMLGAEAVQCGSVFLLTEECPISEIYKMRIAEASVTDTIVTGRTLGDAVRGLKNPFAMKMAMMEQKEMQKNLIRDIGTGALKKAVMEGDWENGSFQVGQAVGLINRRMNCKDLVDNMMTEVQSIIRDKAMLYLPEFSS